MYITLLRINYIAIMTKNRTFKYLRTLFPYFHVVLHVPLCSLLRTTNGTHT